MYSNKNSKNNSNLSNKILIFFGVIILLIVAILILERTGVTNFYGSESSEPSTSDTETNVINLDPPTELEQDAGNKQKEEIVNQENTEQNLNSDDTANVVIVDSTQYESEVEVRAFAANIVKDGVCVINFTKGTESFSKEVPAKADAATTPCLTLEVPRSEFSSIGTWQVEVKYTGDNVSGSASSSVEVF